MLAILDAFADLCALAPERRDLDADADETRGSREHLNTYLRSLDVEREGLPPWFSDRLLRALAHYGVTDLDAEPGARGGVAAHLHRPAAARASSSPIVVALLEGPLPSDRAARDARPDDRVDPAAVPGDRQPRPRRSGTAASTARTSIGPGPRSRPR